jgi:ATP-binding cassette, subfamily B, multidrug efflux pump
MSGNGQDRVRSEPGISDASASGNGQAAPKAPERPKYGPPATGGGGRMWGQARPVEKSLHFFPSLKRLLGHLAPERMILALVVLLAVAGIVMNVLGPKILGMATDVIFTGVLGKDLPSGATKEQVVAALRAQGRNTFADMIERLNVIPGHGIDFVLL